MEEVYLYHTNDLHSHFEKWPRIRSYLNHMKAEKEQAFFFDIGDALDRVHPLTEATDGRANIALLNEVDYQAVTVGNNEGVGASKDSLNHLYDEAEFPVVLANLYDKETKERPKWAQESHLFTTKEGARIGVFGLTASFPFSYEAGGWHVSDWREEIQRVLAKLTEKVDIIILLSHLGIQADKQIARDFPEIDVIMGAHTHHVFEESLLIGNTLVGAAGKFGRYVGEMRLLIDQGKIVEISGAAIQTETLPSVFGEELENEMYFLNGQELLAEQKVAYLTQDYPLDWTTDSALTTLGLKAIQDFAGTDVSILSAGLFLRPLAAGLITKKEIHELLPHPMRIIKVTLKGSDMERLILEMEKNRNFLRHYPMIGLGFRGKVFGNICYDGLTFNQQTKQVLWLGKMLHAEQEYTFATVDHFLYVPFFPTIELFGKNELLYSKLLREVFETYIQKNNPYPN